MNRSLAFLLAFATAITVEAAETRRYLVATRPHAAVHQLLSVAPANEEGVREFTAVDGFAADLTADEAAALRRQPGVRYVTPVVERHLLDDAPSATAAPHTAIANASPYASAQQVPYGVDKVRARELWHLTKGAGSVNVAIIDTGIDFNHPELRGNYAGGYNVINKTAAPFDDHRHGTHVAGTIAAADNGIGVVGIAPEVHVWAIKALGATGSGTDEDLIAAVDWIRAKKKEIGGNWIISMSLGSGDQSPLEAEAFQHAIDDGILCVAASGNDSTLALNYPAAYPGVLAVGAIDSQSHIASFSTGGSGMGVVAPGVGVLSTVPVGLIAAASLTASGGTSYTAARFIGSKDADVTGDYVYCGLGYAADFGAVRGKIALIERGLIQFNEKVRNAKEAGAIGVVIYNSDDLSSFSSFSLIRQDCDTVSCHDYLPDVEYDWPVTVAVSRADGEALRGAAGSKTITIGSWRDDYATLSGTSMATPHVSGVAALLWSLAPNATALDVRQAITRGAHDLGDPAYDLRYGWGAIDAVDSAKQIAPALFGLGAAPPPNTLPAIPRRKVAH